MTYTINKTIIAGSLIWLCALLMGSCSKDSWPAQPDWSKIPNPDEQTEDGFMHPAVCDNKIVAHRGGASEQGIPENSIASLLYSMSLGVYGSECDAYWTKDNNIIIAHADANCNVNGLAPYNSTLAEIRAAGRLSNGEQIPTLEEYIDKVMDKDNCTLLFLDIKRVDKPTSQPQYVINAAKRACEIITEKKAKHFVKLYCTGFDENAMKSAWGFAQKADVEMAMNTSRTASVFSGLGFNWINIAAVQMSATSGGTGSRTLDEYVNAGIEVSVYNVDNKSGDANAVYSDAAIRYYMKNYAYFKTIATNYPAWLLSKISSMSGNTYDGISSMDDFEAFKGAVISDPLAKNFADENGEIVLKTDLTLNDFSPITSFGGVFNGNGHTITINYSGASSSIGLFKELSGTVKNLTITGTLKSTNEEETVFFGAIASKAKNATLINCKNKSTMSVTSESASNAVNMGGMIGSSSNDITLTDCSDESTVNFNSGAYLLYGGMIGATETDDGYIVMKSCSASSKINFAGTNSSSWNYVGGLGGKMVSSGKATASGTDFHLKLDNCSYNGKIAILGAGKVRGGQLLSFANVGFSIVNCTASGEISNTDTSVRDIVLGATVGFIEKNVEGNIQKCTFSGKHISVEGPNNYIGGIYGNTGDNAAIVADGCKTTKTAYVGAPTTKSVGMLAGRPKTAGCTIQNCKIAGVIMNDNTETIITTDNLADWMFIGTGTTASVVLTDNGFNNEN